MKLPDQFINSASKVWAAMPFAVRKRVIHATNPQFLLGVVGLIHDGEGRVLLLEHRFRPPYPWGLPGGFIARGESFEACLRRELAEELALEVTIEAGTFDVEVQHQVESVSVTLVARAPKNAALEPCSREIVRAAWCRPNDLPPDTYPHHAFLVRAFDSLRGKAGTT